MGEWAETLSGDPFLLRVDGIADKMLVFGTSENLSKLADLDTIYVDGTFTTSSLYCQLFTINWFINGQQFPLVYYFLPTKSRADYNRFFTIVKEEMQNLGLTFQPTATIVILSCFIASFGIAIPQHSNPRLFFFSMPVERSTKLRLG